MNDFKETIMLTQIETDIMAVLIKWKVLDDERIAEILTRLIEKLES
jgi:hypothetical protein